MILSIVIYLTALIIVGLLLRKHTNSDEFLISNRNKGAIMIAISLFTLIGGGELATLSTLSYFYGISGIYLFVGFSLGFIFLIFLVKFIRKGLQENLLHSLPDYFYVKYGKTSGLLTTILSFVAFLSLLIIQFSAGALILSTITKWSYELSVLITGSVIAIYLISGGFRSVLVTDIIQGVVMLILLPILLWAMQESKSIETVSASFEQMDTLAILSFVFTGLFVVSASSDIWQRIYAAKSNKSAKIALLIAAVLFILFGFGLTEIGIFAKEGLSNIDPNNAFVESVTKLLPSWAVTVVILLVFSSIMSTADTEIFLLSSILSREISRWKDGYISNEETSKRTSILLARWSVVFITLLGFSLSIFLDELVNIYIFLLSVILIISPPLLIGLWLKLTDKVVSISIVLSLITFITLIILESLNADNLVLIILPGIIFTMFVQLFTKN